MHTLMRQSFDYWQDVEVWGVGGREGGGGEYGVSHLTLPVSLLQKSLYHLMVLPHTSQYRSFRKCVETLRFPASTFGRGSGMLGSREPAASMVDEASLSTKFPLNSSNHCGRFCHGSLRAELSVSFA